MRTPTSAEFTTVRSEGGLLPPDLLRRIVNTDPELGGFAPSDYGLPGHETLREAMSRAWKKARDYWAAFRSATSDLRPDESDLQPTRQQWLLPLLRDLGYRDVAFQPAAETVGEKRYPISYRSGPLPLHLVGCRQSLDRTVSSPGGTTRASPHALLQEYLNLSDSLYGIVSNGLVLRLLRDNPSLTRQASLEFNLEAMFEGGIYSDFVLLYLALHRTRLPRKETEASRCWLERWRENAETRGTRALGELRKGVEEAITALGSGFLAHPANDELRERLRTGEITVADYYQQLLRLVYRLLFLFVAEERDLIYPSTANPANERRYVENYGVTRLRHLARRFRTDERHDDLWRGLQITFQLVAGARSGLDFPAIGGGLFNSDSCRALDGALIANAALAKAIIHLSYVKVDKITRWISYRDMDAEELGGVYEGLLERQPSIRPSQTYPYFELIGSGQRKQTGSYYTPSVLVDELIKSALDPVIADRLPGKRGPRERRAALLGI
ncbi:MAG TPA: hypothetical protein VFZ25_09545, partial [Chloroflexota bacterium]|nr:hypothetical protein [Chloroflexota bacterium]